MSHYFTRSKKSESVGETKIQKLTSKARKSLQQIHVLPISAGSAGSCLSSADSGSLGDSSTEESMSTTYTVKQETPTQSWRRVMSRSASQEVIDDNNRRVETETAPT